MWHRVAALLGCTVAEAQQRLSSAEFVDWCAFYAIEPWGYEADTWRMAVIASTQANYSGRVKKPLKPSDFMPRPRKRTTTDEQIKGFENMGKKDRG